MALTLPLKETGGCRLCNSPRRKHIDIEKQDGRDYRVVRCLECGLVYVLDEYAAISPEYIGLQVTDINKKHIWLQTEHKERAFRQCLGLLRKAYEEGRRKELKGNLLDIGCGIGGWLSFVSARTEFGCYGYDVSPSQIEYSRRMFPLVRCAANLDEYADRLDGALPQFDIITLWDVLEHIRRPVELVNQIAEHLADKGMVFASVPAALPQVLKSRLLSLGWPRSRFSWNPKEHVTYYSPTTLRCLFECSGLRVIKIKPVVVYPRPISLFEAVRRVTFKVLSLAPQISPQILVLATKGQKQ